MSNMGERIEQARRNLGLSQKELAELYGTDRRTIGAWERGENAPRGARLIELARVLGVRVPWLTSGESPMEAANLVAEEGVAYSAAGQDFIPLSVYAPRPSAGPGNHVEAEDQVGAIAFTRELLRDLGVMPQAGCLLQVDGDSMEPTLRTGDLVLLDRSATARPFANGIWVFALRDTLSIKRVQALPSGQFRVLSDNPAYEPYTVDPAADPFRLIGRVVWADRRF